MTRSTWATLVAFLLLALTSTLTSTVLAQSDDEVAPADLGTLDIQLIDQSFDLAPGESIDLTYRLTGELDAVAELTPPTTAPPTTEPPTTPPTATPVTLVPVTDATGAVVAPPPVTAAPTTVAPTTTVAPVDPIVARIVNYPPLTDPSDLRGLIGPDPSTFRLGNAVDGLDLLDVRSSISVTDDGTAEITLSIPTDIEPSQPDLLEFNGSGLHPVVVQFRINDSVIASHATVIEFRTRPTDGAAPITLSLLAAVADPGFGASSLQVNRAVDSFTSLVDVTKVVDAPFTFDVPPAVAAAANPDEAAAQLLSSDELLANPITPFDVSSAVAVGRLDAFVTELIAGEDALRSELPRVPVRREVWLTTTEVSGAAAGQLRDLGVRYLAMPTSVYLSSVSTDPDDPLPGRDRFVELPLPNGATMPVLLIDDELGAQLTTAGTDEALADRTPTEWAIDTVATLRLNQLDAPFSERDDARSHLLATPDLSAPDPRLIQALERFADTSEAISFVPASLLGSITASQDLTEPGELPERAGPPLEARLAAISFVENSLTDAASMLPEGADQLAVWKQQLNTLVSTTYSESDVEAELVTLQNRAEEIRGAVVAPDPFTFTLTGPSTIDVRIQNQLDEPLVVLLRLSSGRLEFPDGDQVITLDADAITAVPVRVEPRSNGTSSVSVEILSPLDQRSLIEPVTLTSRVTALTGLGQVLTGALVLILATWWISHWRAKRRDDPDDDGAVDPADDGEGAVPAGG